MERDQPNLIEAEKIRIASRRYVNLREFSHDRQFDLRSFLDETKQVMILEMDAHVLAVGEERITAHAKWPKDWWQALKDRWFPEWLKRRYPVQYDRLDVDEARWDRVCPHIQVEHRDRCFRFLARGDRHLNMRPE